MLGQKIWDIGYEYHKSIVQTILKNTSSVYSDIAASAAVFCTQPRVIYLNMARYKVKLISVFQPIYDFSNF